MFEMDKEITVNFYGFSNVAGFVLLSIVLFFNIISVYIGVAQPYHTIRLMTAGPQGFESAACYYLNKNIIGWRHFAIKFMLISMPVFMISNGFRMVLKFHRDNATTEDREAERLLEEPWVSVCGWLTFAMFTCMAWSVYLIHQKHFYIFRRRYAELDPQVDLQTQQRMDVQPTTLSSRLSRGKLDTFLDV